MIKKLASLIVLSIVAGSIAWADPLPGGSLDPTSIPKYVTPLVIPPAMPRASKIVRQGGKNIEYYEIAVRQFMQHVLPDSFPMTTVWSYGAVGHPETFNYPAFTIEAKVDKPVRVKWINDLVDINGNFLPHLLPVDQSLHWANPADPDTAGTSQDPYVGPVPIVTHVHGAHVGPESDGFPEAWYLPDANNIPGELQTQGSHYGTFDPANTDPGTAIFQYPNDQRATTLWYHDHSLGITRLNVYAGPAGFYLLRGGNSDLDDTELPGPAPALGDLPGKKYFEIPIVIQDRSFNVDGSWFYPDNRAFFEGLDVADLQIPFIPDPAKDGLSDVPSMWNPEFFGNTIVVNGRTWPYLEVEDKRYRLRLLNGSNSRFLILKMDNDQIFYQIGNEGGFLPDTIALNELLIAPAERADVIVDFAGLEGETIIMQNIGPDEPYGGGIPGVDFDSADPGTTGQVMQFRVVKGKGKDKTTPPLALDLPEIVPLGEAGHTRKVSLNEEESSTVFVVETAGGEIVFDANSDTPFGPISALLGTVDGGGNGVPLLWGEEITENPDLNATEVWEIYNFTEDAHPIHLHLVMFEVLGREVMDTQEVRGPEAWEAGFKDTVIAFPGEITRIKAHFDIEGLFVWHCHILEHEDNEMMRPYCVGSCD